MKSNRNYPLLLTSQFLSAFGDQAVLGVILGQLTFQLHKGTLSEQQLGSANALYACLLYLPYVLLAPLAGFLNDRFPKTRWLLGGNCIKLVGLGVAALSLLGPDAWQSLGYLIIGIESVAAVNNLEALLAAGPVDGVFVGPHDLTATMG